MRFRRSSRAGRLSTREARAKYLGARAPACALHADRSRPHKSWRSRGYLPYLDQPEIIQAVTFRLADSIPADVIAAWKSELALTGAEEASDPRCVELRERIERYTEEGHGACWLRDGRVADEVEKALLHFDGVRYRLLAWVIMPNHMHALVETMPGFPLDGVIQSWKSFTAKQVNKILDRSGQFWMPDYFDRYIRNGLCCIKIMRTAIPYRSSRLCPEFDLYRIGPSQGSHPIEDSTVGSGFYLLTFPRYAPTVGDRRFAYNATFLFQQLIGDDIHFVVSTPSVPSFESCAGSHLGAEAGPYNCRAGRSWHCVEEE